MWTEIVDAPTLENKHILFGNYFCQIVYYEKDRRRFQRFQYDPQYRIIEQRIDTFFLVIMLKA